jgi:hypothetical protein
MTARGRVLLYGESYVGRYRVGGVGGSPSNNAAAAASPIVSVKFSPSLTRFARCGVFGISRVPLDDMACVLENTSMSLEHLVDLYESGELWRNDAGEEVWNALADAEESENDEPNAPQRRVCDLTGLLFVAGIFVDHDGAVCWAAARHKETIVGAQTDPLALQLAIRAKDALVAHLGASAQPPLVLARAIATQIRSFRDTVATRTEVLPIASEQDVVLLWGVDWVPGQFREAIAALALPQRARLLQFSPSAIFDTADNAALVQLCVQDMPLLEALCLKGTTGLLPTTVERLLHECAKLRFLCIAGATVVPLLSSDVKAKCIHVSRSGAVADSAYDWFVASAVPYYRSRDQIEAAAQPMSPVSPAVVSTVPVQVRLTPVAEWTFPVADAHKRSFMANAEAYLSHSSRKLVIDQFPVLPLAVLQGAKLFIDQASDGCHVHHRVLLCDELVSGFVDLSLWFAAGFVVVAHQCTVREHFVRWWHSYSLQPLLGRFCERFLAWTGNEWSQLAQFRSVPNKVCLLELGVSVQFANFFCVFPCSCGCAIRTRLCVPL